MCKSAEMSGLILQTTLDTNTEKGPQKILVHGSTCNIYLEKFWFGTNLLYLLPEARTVIWHFTAKVKSLHMQEGAQELNSGHGQHDLEPRVPPHSSPA